MKKYCTSILLILGFALSQVAQAALMDIVPQSMLEGSYGQLTMVGIENGNPENGGYRNGLIPEDVTLERVNVKKDEEMKTVESTKVFDKWFIAEKNRLDKKFKNVNKHEYMSVDIQVFKDNGNGQGTSVVDTVSTILFLGETGQAGVSTGVNFNHEEQYIGSTLRECLFDGEFGPVVRFVPTKSEDSSMPMMMAVMDLTSCVNTLQPATLNTGHKFVLREITPNAFEFEWVWSGLKNMKIVKIGDASVQLPEVVKLSAGGGLARAKLTEQTVYTPASENGYGWTITFKKLK